MTRDATGLVRRSGRRPSLARVNHEPAPALLPGTVAVPERDHEAVHPDRLGRGRTSCRRPAAWSIVVNHISNTDPLAIGQFLAYSGRWPHFLAKSSLFGVPLLGSLLRAAEQLPVAPQQPRRPVTR